MDQKPKRRDSEAFTAHCGEVPKRARVRVRGRLSDCNALYALGLACTIGALAPHPSARGQAQEGAGTAGAAQDVPGAARAAQDREPERETAEAVSTRYRFLEKYSVNPDPTHPELVTEYQVGVLETAKTVYEKPRGAPDRAETSRQTVYVERTAKVSKTNDLMEAVRRYDGFRWKDLASTSPPQTPLFRGLTIWVHRRATKLEPVVVSLTEGRPLRDYEYVTMARQVSFPPLTALLPATPVRVGDTWRVSPQAAVFLLGELPEPDDYDLSGTLKDVHKAPSDSKLTAVIGISGELTLSQGPSAVNAELLFSFEPRALVLPTPGAGGAARSAEKGGGTDSAKARGRTVDALGWITEVRMARTVSSLLPEGEGRLKQISTLELDLRRRTLAEIADKPGQNRPAPLVIPDPLPKVSPENSWLIYDDPLKRFHFRHPQELLPNARQTDPNAVELVDQSHRGDVMIIQLPPKEASTERDRQSHDPQWHRKKLYALWDEQHMDVLHGPTDWLPEADWAPLKRKVYRIEAALKTKDADAGGAQRVYCDYYVVLFTPANQSIVVTAMTQRDTHVEFRDEAEDVIRSFQFGPSELQGAAKNPGVPPAPAR